MDTLTYSAVVAELSKAKVGSRRSWAQSLSPLVLLRLLTKQKSVSPLFSIFSFLLAKLSKVKVGWTLLGADFFPKDTFRISGAVTTWWRWGWHGKGIKHCNYFGWSAFNCRFIKPLPIHSHVWLALAKSMHPSPVTSICPKLNTAGVHFLVSLNSIQMWFTLRNIYLAEIEHNDDPTFLSHPSGTIGFSFEQSDIASKYYVNNAIA